MPIQVMLAGVIVGAGAVIAGLAALSLPPERWLGAAIALVLAAGVGVVVLAVGLFIAGSHHPTHSQTAILVASTCGLGTEIITLRILKRRLDEKT